MKLKQPFKKKSTPRIAFFSGTFDPIHLGHITFALETLHKYQLDEIYFMPERSPLNKIVDEHYAYRVGMIKEAIKPYPNLKLLDLNDKNFTVHKTLPKLINQFPKAELSFMFGSDKVPSMTKWPNFSTFLKRADLIIGLRNKDCKSDIEQYFIDYPKSKLKYVESFAPNLSSSMIRDLLYNNVRPQGVLPSVFKYIRHHWLYVSIN
jgi:nicotinate-nucleotide adenylyltransferase